MVVRAMQQMPAWFMYFTIAQTVVMFIATVLLLVLRAGASGGQLLRVPKDLTSALEDVKRQNDEFRRQTEKRFDDASGKMSRFASMVEPMPSRLDDLEENEREDHAAVGKLRDDLNTLPLRLQNDFVLRREAEDRVRESRDDRERLQRELDRQQRMIDELRFGRGVGGGV